MKEYDIYLPLSFNDGRPVGEQTVNRVKGKLTERFGGLTYFPQENEGVWKFGGTTFRDRVVILRVLAPDAAEARKFFAGLKPELLKSFEQTSILIVERAVELVG